MLWYVKYLSKQVKCNLPKCEPRFAHQCFILHFWSWTSVLQRLHPQFCIISVIYNMYTLYAYCNYSLWLFLADELLCICTVVMFFFLHDYSFVLKWLHFQSGSCHLCVIFFLRHWILMQFKGLLHCIDPFLFSNTFNPLLAKLSVIIEMQVIKYN